MGYLGWVIGTPSWTISLEVDSFDGATVTYDVYWWGGPGVAQASLSNSYNSTAATAWVYQANDSIYMKAAAYKKDLKHVTFAVLGGYAIHEGWNHWVGALLNIVYFAPGATVLETT